MGDAVANQVIQHAPQKPVVGKDAHGLPQLHLGKRKPVAAFQTAVKHFADRLTADFRPVHFLEVNGLERVFQLGRQVKIVDGHNHHALQRRLTA